MAKLSIARVLQSIGIGLRAEGPEHGPASDFWYGPAGGNSLAGQYVNADTAMRIATAYACVKILGESVASLPLIVYRRRKGGGKDRATDHPLYDLLHDQPNATETSMEFRERAMAHVLLRGTAYARIWPGPRGPVDTLEILSPDCMTPERLPNGRLRFRYRPPGAATDTRLVQDEVFRVPGLSLDGLKGLNPMEYHRETIGTPAAQADYLARFYRNDSRPGGVIETTGQFMDSDKLKTFRELWQETGTGKDRQKVRILQAGMTYKEIGLKHTDAQFLEMWKVTRADVATMFRIPLHMVGLLDRATNNNIEQQALEFVTHTLRPWLVRWEQAIKRDLIAENDIFAEFQLDGLLRGSSNARQFLYREALTDGWMTPNEVRELENRNPLDGLDEPRQPLNMAPVNGPPAAPNPGGGATAAAPGSPVAHVPGDAQARLLAIARGNAERALRREIDRLEVWAKRMANDAERFTVKLPELYREHAEYLTRGLCLTEAQAETYCAAQQEIIARDGLVAVQTWGEPQITRLFNLALEEDGP